MGHAVRRYGSAVEPYMQAMHFFFALGAVLSPLLIQARACSLRSLHSPLPAVLSSDRRPLTAVGERRLGLRARLLARLLRDGCVSTFSMSTFP